MDSHNKARLGDVPLDRLVGQALRRLQVAGYSRKSLKQYDTTWRHLMAFAGEKGFGEDFSEHLAADFVEACCSHPEASRPWRRYAAFHVTMLADFRRDGRFERSRADKRELNVPPAMRKPLRDYERYCKDRRHLKVSTIAERIPQLARFLDFLGRRGVETLPDLQAADLTAYVVWLERFRKKPAAVVSGVRQFLQYLTMRGIVQQRVGEALPRTRIVRDATIPSVWDADILVKLLEAVDRSSPVGKRDYAILLLASRLGLREGDIRALRLDDLDWGASTVGFTQSKTGGPVLLPMSEEVGEALIDYLRFGRPKTEHREVFLTIHPTARPLEDTSLYHVVNRWRDLAGIQFRRRQRHGLHSLRHTLATQLLREETPIHVISGILGHDNPASTMIYAKADTEMLRSAALDTEEARHVE